MYIITKNCFKNAQLVMSTLNEEESQELSKNGTANLLNTALLEMWEIALAQEGLPDYENDLWLAVSETCLLLS